MHFIGDVHGKFYEYFKLIADLQESIQLGDFGLGFGHNPDTYFEDMFGINIQNHKFIRGNHDNPSDCKLYNNYLGDFGITEDNIFYVSGAFSIDQVWRKSYKMRHGVDIWWPDEELSESQHKPLLRQYKQYKPDIVASHDCPAFVKEHIKDGNADIKQDIKTRTGDILMPKMFEIHKPKVWIFGHYHCSTDVIINGTRFVGLAELEVKEIKL